MSRRTLYTVFAVAILAGPVLRSRPAAAHVPTATYRPWTGVGAYGKPRPLARRPARLPRLPESEYGRSTGELVAGAAGALGWCSDTPISCFRTSPPSLGLGGSVSILWRPASYFSWGGRLGIRRMVVPDMTQLRPEGTATHAAALVLLGRVYLASEGVTEPYVDLGAGAARVETATFRTDRGVVRDAGLDWTFEVGGGLDFFISSGARLGPALTFVHALVEEPTACSAQPGEVCSPVGRRWRLLSMTTLGARLSLLFGDPL